MGEAKRKREAAAAALGRSTELADVVARAGSALKRLTEAASAHPGSDCYLHAVLGRVLLADNGFDAQIRVGEAAWRLGPGDGDVLSHAPGRKAFGPAGMSTGQMALAYHAWLIVHDNIVDLTTYQFAKKARMLDKADGGQTMVVWEPETLILPLRSVMSHREVAKSPDPGVAFYEAHPELMKLMASTYTLDLEDVTNARRLMANPGMQAFGPNNRSDVG